MSNNSFDNYLTTHLQNIDSGIKRENRTDALRANYLELFRKLERSAAVLEIGPGHGDLFGMLRNEVGLTNVTAIDLSREVVEFCNAQWGGGVTLVEDTRRFLEQHESSFDAIVLLHVLEHVPRSETVPLLRAMHGALRPGGCLVIEVPNMGNPLVGLTNRYADFTHEVGFTESSLVQVLRMASFDSLDVRRFRLHRTSVFRWIQWMARGTLEAMLTLAVMLYTRSPEINSASIVATARRSAAIGDS